MDKKGSMFLPIEMLKWGVIYPIVFAVLAILMSVALQMHVNREVESDKIEFIIAKNTLSESFSERGVIVDSTLKKFTEYNEPKLAMHVKIANGDYYSNSRLYQDKGLCGIKNSPFKCSDMFTEFYLFNGTLEKAEIDLVMKRE